MAIHPTDMVVWAQTDGGKRIGTARDTIGAIRKRQATLLSWVTAQAEARSFPIHGEVQGEVEASVNHGHWVVQCPWCTGAEEADPAQPVFYCLSCANMENGNHVAQVVFPKGRDRVEALLLMRPIENRNWKPGESVNKLLRENVEHGVS